MNKIYRLVWNATLRAWVVASELAKGHRRGSGSRGRPFQRRVGNRAVVCACLSLAAFPVYAAGGISSTALPTGGAVTAGAGSISRSGNTLTVNQSTQNLSLNWTSFNIGTQGTVDFNQPSSSSIAVNRIGGNNGSQILGNLDANGQVYLINPNGILFGPDARVNVGGIVASTLDLRDSQLGSGTLDFSGSGTGSIINKGSITANGSLVALIGNQVINQGVISAQLGGVALAGGSGVTLTFSSDQLVDVRVDQSTLNNLVRNGQLIQADGGRVWMTAGAADSLLASAVNNSGVVEAQTFENHKGTITLLSGMDAGTTTASGTLDASAPNGGNGGNIETSGHTVNVAAGATVTTAAPQGKGGNWLIDPADFTIAPSGGNMTGLQLSSSLGTSGSVTIESSSGTAGGSGNINVDDTVTVGGTSSLTLIAADNININGIINVGGTASLNLQTATTNGGDAAVPGGTVNVALSASGFSAFVALDSTSSLTINGNPYTIITSAGALQAMGSSGYYALGGEIDASSISNFTQIPTFSGVFDGLGNTIFNLSTSVSEGGGGLFGALTPSSVVSNLGLTGSVTSTSPSTDGLATMTNGTLSNVWVSMTASNAEISATNGGTIDNAYAFGTVTPTADDGTFGGQYNGGLVGLNNGTISNSFAGTMVSGGGSTAGGLVGRNGPTGTISNSTASGSSAGGLVSGGLVGQNQGSITNSVATGAVAAGNPNNVDSGGLVGDNSGSISSSYATGPVNGGINESGGLVGLNNATGTISDSFATGSVTGVSGSRNGGLVGYNQGAVSDAYATGSPSGVIAGGLVGINDPGATITNTYATGAVTGATTAGGGLVGKNNGTVSVSYFDPTTTGQANGVGTGTSTGVTSLSPQQWLTQGPIAADAWDTTSIWVANAGLYPILQSLPYVLVTPSAGTSTYGNTAITASVGSTQLVIPAGWTVPDYPTTAALSPSTPTWVGSATPDSDATTAANGNPTYLFAGTGVTATGFQVATTVGTLAVDPALLLETATPASSIYGSTPSGLTGTVTGWVNSQSTASNTSGNWSTPATANSNVGNYAIDGSSLTLTGAAAGNYSFQQAASNSTALTIDPATLLETATPSSSTYGSTPSGLTGTVTGWVNSQSTAGNTGGNWSTPATANSNVGTYAINGSSLTLTGAAAGNYTVTQAASNGTALTIDPATLLETATPSSSTYGSTPSGLTGTVTGWANGQSTASNASGLTWMTPATANSNVGNYAIDGSGLTLTGAATGNYTVNQAASNGTALTIDPATLLETATPSSSTYGSSPSGLTGTVTGWANGQSTASNASGLTWMTPATANSHVGSYAIDGSGLTLTGAAAGNYTVDQAASNGTALTIDPATLLETATPSSSTYGSTPSGLTGSVTGWVNGQSTASNTSGNWSTPATANSNVGTYAINGSSLTLTGAAAGNYTVTQAASNGTALTIDPATLLETATPSSSTYGSTPSGLTGSVTGWANGQSTASNTSGNWITPATANSNVGNYAIDGNLTLTGAATGNYTVTQAASNSSALTIDPATLIETATPSNSTFGSTPSGLTGTVTGWVNGQSTASNASGLTWITPATANSNIGNYAIDGSGLTLTGAATGNYTVTQAASNSSALTIGSATLIETATPSSSTYGSTPSGLTGTVTGWINGQSTASNTSGLTWITPATANSNVGNYAIDGSGLTLTGAAAGNYTLQQAASNSSALTIQPATLLETATPGSSTYGSTPSGLTGGLSGWVNGQSTASNASGLTWITPATANSNAGNYAIDGSGLTLTGAAAGNYTVTQAAGNSSALTIDPATLLETATPSSSTYGSTPSGLTGTVTGWVNGQSTASNTSGNWGTPATANSNVGNYAIDGSSLTLTGAAGGNYTLQQAASNSSALTIDPAALLETATPSSSTYGSTPSGLTGSVTGWVNGQSTASNTNGNWSTPATANSNVGNYAIDGSGLTLTGAAAGNYTLQQAASNSSALTIDPATLIETATPASSTLGTTPSGLTGSVTGWVNGQSTASNASGLTWMTPATANSSAGNYAIDGSGLTLTGAAAGNYTLMQAASNSTALTINASPVTQSSQSYVSSILTSGGDLTNGGDLANGGSLTNGGIVPNQATPEPTIVPVQIPASSGASTSGNAAGPQVNMTQAIAGNGTLEVIDNGVNLSSVPQSSATPPSWERTSCAAH